MRSPSPDSLRDQIRGLVATGLEAADSVAVIAVANLVDDSTLRTVFDRETEYFTEVELEQVVSAFRAGGFYCDVLVGERSFIDWVRSGESKTLQESRQLLVYNTAQSGTGPGRKSLIPSFCMLERIPTLNADPYSASLSRHKFHVSAILSANEIPVPRTWWYLGEGAWLNDARPPTGAHVLAKSTYESASIGISDASSFFVEKDLEDRLDSVRDQLSQPVVVQEFVAGREVETPVVGEERQPLALKPIGISIDGCRDLGDGYLSYERVSHDDYGFYEFENDFPDLSPTVRRLATMTARVLQLPGFCRVDARIDGRGSQAFITDVATTPHLVSHSSYDYCFQQLGFDRSEMLAALVGCALRRS